MIKQIAYAVIRHNAPAVDATFAKLDEALTYADRLAADVAGGELDYVEQSGRLVWNIYCDGDHIDRVFVQKVQTTIELA